MSAHGKAHLSLCIRLFVHFRGEETRLLNTIHLHKFVSGLGDRLTSVLFLFKEVVELLELIVLLKNILNIANLHLSSFSDLLFLLCANKLLGIVLFLVVHGTADLVLPLKDLDLGVLAPHHQLERALLLQSVKNALVKIVH